jgi:uncharacterized small protein (DUF1192 family)
MSDRLARITRLRRYISLLREEESRSSTSTERTEAQRVAKTMSQKVAEAGKELSKLESLRRSRC